MTLAKLALLGGSPIRSRPFPSWPQWGREEEEGLLRVLHSGKWGSLHGSETACFEDEFARFLGARHAVAVTNGTAALEVALRAAGLQAGDEVIIPAYTFVATATAVIANGAIPRFADIDPETYNLDIESARALVNERTRAIIPVHFAGRPADMDAVLNLAARHNLIVIEDAAQAWGARWRDRCVGTYGHAGCFSFQSSKNVTAGEGGMVVTDDDTLAPLIRSFVNCGRLESGLWYAHYYAGGNYRITEFQAAVLRAQLARYPRQLAQRQQSMHFLDEALAKLPGLVPLRRDPRETSHACHIYIVRLQPDRLGLPDKTSFIRALQAEGIPASSGYSLPLYRQPLFRDRVYGPFTPWLKDRACYDDVQLPNTERACLIEAIWLPQSLLLAQPEDLQDVVRAFEKVIENRHELENISRKG